MLTRLMLFIPSAAVRGDLVKVLKELLDRKIAFDGIIIETTGGVAGHMPRAVAWPADSGQANGTICGRLA